jgi:hypothetical protein
MRRRRPPLLAAVAIASAVACAALAPSPARGAGDQSADLVQGGRVKGDVSDAAGETDLVGVDLVKGQTLRATWSASFEAGLVVRDPAGDPATLFSETGRRRAAPVGFVVPATGRWTFEIRSADGGEGRYELAALPSWDKAVRFTGDGPATATIEMPAGATLGARLVGPSPVIAALRGPDAADLLDAPIVGRGRSAVLPATPCPTTGAYAIDLDAAGAFRATLVRRAAKVPLVKLDVRNGLNGAGFVSAGVKDLFARRCAGCHEWAAGYSGVRGHAPASLSRMRKGDMPAVGAPIDAAGIALFQKWIDAGYPR